MPSSLPSRRGYAVGIFLAVVPMVTIVALMIASVPGGGTSSRGVIPGTVEAALEAGDYLVFVETRSEIDGAPFVADADPGGVTCAVEAERQPAAALTTDRSASYESGAFEGESLYGLSLNAPATARVTCETRAGRAVVAVHAVPGGPPGWVLWAMFALCVVGQAVIAITYFRSKANAQA